MGHFFLIHQPAQQLGIVERGVNQLHARHRGGKREPPGGGVEHRHDRKRDRLRRQVETGRRDLGHRLQHTGSVLVEHTLGISGRAAGVAQHARLALRSLDPGIIPVMRGEEIAEFPVVEADIMFDAGPLRLEPLDDRRECAVVEKHAIVGMVGDVDQLLVEQARIDRVDDAAHPDRAIPGDQMVMMVHAERRDPVPALQAHRLERLGELAGLAGDPGPVGAGDAPVGPGADHFAASMFTLGMFEHARDPKLEILHPANHAAPPHSSRRRLESPRRPVERESEGCGRRRSPRRISRPARAAALRAA